MATKVKSLTGLAMLLGGLGAIQSAPPERSMEIARRTLARVRHQERSGHPSGLTKAERRALHRRRSMEGQR